jgi:hypothetical protein
MMVVKHQNRLYEMVKAISHSPSVESLDTFDFCVASLLSLGDIIGDKKDDKKWLEYSKKDKELEG